MGGLERELKGGKIGVWVDGGGGGCGDLQVDEFAAFVLHGSLLFRED